MTWVTVTVTRYRFLLTRSLLSLPLSLPALIWVGALGSPPRISHISRMMSLPATTRYTFSTCATPHAHPTCLIAIAFRISHSLFLPCLSHAPGPLSLWTSLYLCLHCRTPLCRLLCRCDFMDFAPLLCHSGTLPVPFPTRTRAPAPHTTHCPTPPHTSSLDTRLVGPLLWTHTDVTTSACSLHFSLLSLHLQLPASCPPIIAVSTHTITALVTPTTPFPPTHLVLHSTGALCPVTVPFTLPRFRRGELGRAGPTHTLHLEDATFHARLRGLVDIPSRATHSPPLHTALPHDAVSLGGHTCTAPRSAVRQPRCCPRTLCGASRGWCTLHTPPPSLFTSLEGCLHVLCVTHLPVYSPAH